MLKFKINSKLCLLTIFLLIGCSSQKTLDYDDFLNEFNDITLKASQKDEYQYFTYEEENYSAEDNQLTNYCYKYNAANYYLDATITSKSSNNDSMIMNFTTYIKNTNLYYFYSVQINKRVVSKIYFVADSSYTIEGASYTLYEEYINEFNNILSKNVLLDRLAYLKNNFINHNPIFASQKSLTPSIKDDNLLIEFGFENNNKDEYNNTTNISIRFNEDSIIEINSRYEDKSYIFKKYDDQKEVIFLEKNIEDYEFNKMQYINTHRFNYL